MAPTRDRVSFLSRPTWCGRKNTASLSTKSFARVCCFWRCSAASSPKLMTISVVLASFGTKSLRKRDQLGPDEAHCRVDCRRNDTSTIHDLIPVSAFLCHDERSVRYAETCCNAPRPSRTTPQPYCPAAYFAPCPRFGAGYCCSVLTSENQVRRTLAVSCFLPGLYPGPDSASRSFLRCDARAGPIPDRWEPPPAATPPAKVSRNMWKRHGLREPSGRRRSARRKSLPQAALVAVHGVCAAVPRHSRSRGCLPAQKLAFGYTQSYF